MKKEVRLQYNILKKGEMGKLVFDKFQVINLDDEIIEKILEKVVSEYKYLGPPVSIIFDEVVHFGSHSGYIEYEERKLRFYVTPLGVEVFESNE